VKQLEPGDTNLTSFVKDGRPTVGCWSAGFWQKVRNRPGDRCACGVTTTRYACTVLVGVGRSRFEIEDVAECEGCGWTRAIEILRARQANLDISPALREREAVTLRELEAELVQVAALTP